MRGVHVRADKVREGVDVLTVVVEPSDAIPAVAPPSVAPASGAVDSFFTITDPGGRVRSSDVALFYPVGADPLVAGVLATGVVISPDGKTLTGLVPLIALGDAFVSVRGATEVRSRFKPDLRFEVT